MLTEILHLIEGETQTQVSANPAIPNEQSGEIAQLTNETVANQLQQSLTSGGLTSILGLLSGQPTTEHNNSLVQSMIEQLTGKLSEKHQLTPSVANGLATTLIPSIMSQIAAKSNDENDKSMDINTIIGGIIGQPTKVGEHVSMPGQGNVDFSQILAAFTGNGGQPATTDTQGMGFDIGQLTNLFGPK